MLKMIKLTLIVATAIAATSSFAQSLANANDVNLVTKTCPPLAALKHASSGAPWTLDQQSIDAGFYVVQTPDAVASKLTSFDKMYGGLSVFFNDRKYGPRFDVTCRYESGEDVVEVKSLYQYDYQSVVENYNQFQASYIEHGRSGLECAKGFADGSFGSGTERMCEWKAYVVNTAK